MARRKPMKKKKIENWKKELEIREEYERKGYIWTPSGAVIISCCPIETIIYHFKRKEELRKLIYDQKKRYLTEKNSN